MVSGVFKVEFDVEQLVTLERLAVVKLAAVIVLLWTVPLIDAIDRSSYNVIGLDPSSAITAADHNECKAAQRCDYRAHPVTDNQFPPGLH